MFWVVREKKGVDFFNNFFEYAQEMWHIKNIICNKTEFKLCDFLKRKNNQIKNFTSK